MDRHVWILLGILSSVLTLVGLFLLVWYLGLWRKAKRTLEEPPAPRDAPRIEYRRANYSVPFIADFQLGAQSLEWQSQMRAIGRALERHDVTTIGLLHGTFVGTDPMGFLSFARLQKIPGLPRLIDRLEPLIKSSIDTIARDLGNFNESYRQLLEESLGGLINVETVHWPSGNYHVARLKGAVAALLWIDKQLETRPKTKRVLLVGHSHAGQVFALLSRMLNHMEEGQALLDVAGKVLPEDVVSSLQKRLDRVRSLKIDFVTLGTPPVYHWILSKNLRLMHIINHRGAEPTGGSLLGVLHTRAGDYVQQVAVTGTDSLAFSRAERVGNIALDALLGKGIALATYLTVIREHRRIHDSGVTYLMDFDDASRLVPNAIQTFFGHGVYTRGYAMLELWRLIGEELYDGKN